uniref:Uncharacterized protein n=1 Tax=Panagrolaimus sp. JU765 TaxID=591449 RepID=A0AC34QY75_9BILA
MLNLEIDLANLTNFYVNDIEIQKPKSARDYNQDLWNLQTIQQKIPGIKWADYLQNLVSDDLWHKISVGNEAVINADSPDYFDSLAQLLQKYRPRDIRNYAIWRLIKYSLPYMSSEYTAALAKFNSVLYGKNVTATPQADVCLSYLKGNYELPNLGFATAEAMLARGYFSVKAKNRAVAKSKVKLMDSSIAYPDWILNKTAQQAYYKDLQIPSASFISLNLMLRGWAVRKQLTEVAVPLDRAYYKDLQIPSASFISLNLMLRGWAVRKQLTEVAVPLDRGAFPGTPMATDAWYTASTNSLTVPLGELQSPFFGLDFPDAVNFGGAGAVVGHECSHGFDENGAMFNAYGNETNWWTDSSKRAFEDHCNCLINQFNHYCYPNNIGCVNGNQTIDENVADLAGIKAAFKAYKKQSTPQYRLAKAPMFSDDQLFFLSFASFWCGKDTDGAIQQQLQTDVHTPKKFRVIGTLRNVPEFSQAFQCSDSSYMNPKEKCSIW